MFYSTFCAPRADLNEVLVPEDDYQELERDSSGEIVRNGNNGPGSVCLLFLSVFLCHFLCFCLTI